MTTPPKPPSFVIPPIPSLPSPSTSKPRGSISSTFSFDPSHLVNSYIDASTSTTGRLKNTSALDPSRSILPVSPLRSPRRARRTPRDQEAEKHPLAQESTVDVFYDGEDDEFDHEREWGMVDRMRLWRHDAMMQHLYETAAFWGDKVLSWTNDKNDAFWLAQIFFLTHQYARAERLLTRPFYDSEDVEDAGIVGSAALTNGHRFTFSGPFVDKGKGRETAPAPPRLNVDLQANLPINTPTSSRLAMGEGAGDLAAGSAPGMSRLVDMSVACRYLAAQCQVRQGKWAEATEMLGEANPFRGTMRSGPQIANVDGGIKIEASMCYLRGMLMLKLNRGDTAKECFMEALALDVKCYDAFNQLISGEMMTSDEEWNFVQGLAYKDQTPAESEFIRLIYTARLRKYKHAEEHALTRRRLTEEFGLSDNPDVLFSFADALYAQLRWPDCFAITTRILSLVSVHAATMPLHIACMHHLHNLHSKLFILAHEMVEKEPEAPMSWYAVGVWYLTSKKWSQARTYFSKTSLMDPRFAPAWIAFAHTFALEGEHDHAVTAYSTCARLFTGSHLPLLFIGMEHIMLSNFDMADEALSAANQLCDGDPLLFNERGVMAFNRGKYNEAVDLFLKALEQAKVSQDWRGCWITTFVNLGSAQVRLGLLTDAENSYRQALEKQPRHATALSLLGKVFFLKGDVNEAIVKFHESLSIEPLNGHVVELLNLALELNVDIPPMSLSRQGWRDPQDEITVRGMQRSWEGERLKEKAKAASREPSWRDEEMVVE